MPGWMLIVCFVFGYVASSYHLPYMLYEQLISVPDMSHKVLIAFYYFKICNKSYKMNQIKLCKNNHKFQSFYYYNYKIILVKYLFLFF